MTTPNDGADTCSTLPLDTPSVYVTVVAKDAPDMKGGPIEDGTYDLVEDALYTGAGGDDGTTDDRIALSMIVHGDRFELVRSEGRRPHSFSGTLKIDGTTLTAITSCPAEEWEPMGYTATDTELRLALGGIVSEQIVLRLRQP